MPPTSPLTPMLARPAEHLGDVSWSAGDCAYEPKFDGYRALVSRHGDRVRIVSRHGTVLTGGFPEIVAAARAQLPPGTVLDGELVVWRNGRLDFAALAPRLGSGRRAASAARTHPASFLAFDVLEAGGADVRRRPLRQRRSDLERLAAGWAPPLQLTPQTTDRDVAETWMADYAATDTGVEGVVVKRLTGTYQSGRRGWVKVRIRHTHDVVVGAVTGSLAAPARLVLGVPEPGGRLWMVGATHLLAAADSARLGQLLAPADATHPWPQVVAARMLGQLAADQVNLVRVAPLLVVEVSADTAFEHGRWRHPCRFVRHRPDVTAATLTLPLV